MKRLRLLLVVSGLLLGLTACGGGGSSSPAVLKPLGSPSAASAPSAAAPTPTLTSSPSPTAAGTVDPGLPAAARELTSEGAQAFATYYIEALAQAITSGDVRTVQRLSDPGCGGCQDYIRSISGARSRHETVDGKNVLRVRFAVAPAVEDDETTVLLNLDGDEYVRRAADGSVVARDAAANSVPHEMRCIWLGQTWIAAGLRRVQP